MNIASLVLRIRPETRAEAESSLHALPGVECHQMTNDGRLIVTVEDAPGAAMSDTLIAIHRVPQVLAATAPVSALSIQIGTFVKLVSWYDNEWGYSNRVVELTKKIAAKL